MTIIWTPSCNKDNEENLKCLKLTIYPSVQCLNIENNFRWAWGKNKGSNVFSKFLVILGINSVVRSYRISCDNELIILIEYC